MCQSFQRLLKNTKKENGNYANNKFNFVKKPHVMKALAAIMTAIACNIADDASTNANAAAMSLAKKAGAKQKTGVGESDVKKAKVGNSNSNGTATSIAASL